MINEDQKNNITLKTNDVTIIVHRYYFHTYDTRVAKNNKNVATSSPGLPYGTKFYEEKKIFIVRFEVPTEVNIKAKVYYRVTKCSLVL
jgi:hypothetical protein